MREVPCSVTASLLNASQFGERISPMGKEAPIPEVNGTSCRHAHTSEFAMSLGWHRYIYEAGYTFCASILFSLPLHACLSVWFLCLVIWSASINSKLWPQRGRHRLLWLCVIASACITPALASYDEDVMDQMQQRHHAAIAQQLQEAADRWQWVFQHIGIERPSPHAPSELTFHRPTNLIAYFPVSYDFDFTNVDDAVDCVQAVEEVWEDLGPYDLYPEDWIVLEIHRSIAASQLPSDRHHWILVARQDLSDHVGMRPVMTEVRWHSRSSCEIVTMAMWLTSHTHRLRVLQEIGILRACSSTHQCHLQLNGSPSNHADFEMQAGAFILITGVPVLSEALFLSVEPQALPRPRSPISSTSYGSDTDQEPHVEEPSPDPEPYEARCQTTVYRPLLHPNQVSFVSLATESPGSIPRDVCLQHWPDIATIEWRTVSVHASYYVDFPPFGCHDVVLLWDAALASRQLRSLLSLVTISWIGMTYSTALYLPTPLTRIALLALLRLDILCGTDSIHQCGVHRNGMPLLDGETGDIEGQYIHVDLTAFDRRTTELIIDDIFGVTSAASGFEYMDDPILDHFVQISTGDASEVVSRHSHESYVPRDDHALYWILCAWIYGSLAFFLTASMIQRPSPVRRKVHSHTIHRQIRGALFATILISAQGIQIHQDIARSWTLVDVPSPCSHRTDPTTGLPPPGNPHFDTPLCITDDGLGYIDTICRFLERTQSSISLDTALGARQTLRIAPLLPFRSDDTPDSGLFCDEATSVPEKKASWTQTIDVPFHADDLDDLFEPWDVTSLPTLVPSESDIWAIKQVLGFPFITADDDTILYIYTDGSYSKHGEAPGATWAFAIFAIKDDVPVIRDWYADFVTTDWYDTAWVGAKDVNVRSAESTALILSCLYSMQASQTEKVCLFSDAVTVIHAATGEWSLPPDDLLAQNLRATFMASHCLRCREGLTIQHVRSHSNILGNEFADFLAVGVREGRIAPRPIPRAYDCWFNDASPKIHNAWLLIDQLHREAALPLFSGKQMSWTSPTTKPPVNWLPCGPAPSPLLPTLHTLSLVCVQFNVCTLLKPGATTYMREQIAELGIHIAGLQETRTPQSEIIDSSFIRIISPAIKGQGGTELWFNRLIPFTHGPDGSHHIKRDALLVIHCDPELLFVTLTLGWTRILCISAHAPHKAHEKTQIKQWWTHLSALFRTLYRHDSVLMFIDANASIGAALPWIGDVAEEDFNDAGRAVLALCQEFDLWVPSTFENLHWGSSATWQSSTSRKTRIDFIITSRSSSLQCTDSWICDNLDAGHDKLDHIPLYGRFCAEQTQMDPPRDLPRFDREAIAQADSETWCRFFADWPLIDWRIDVTSHAKVIEEHLHTKLQDFFPFKPQHRKGSVFSSETWALHSSRQLLRKQLRAHRHDLEIWLQWIGLQRWKSLPCSWSVLLGFSLRCAHRWIKLQQLSAQLHSSIASDRRIQLDTIVKDLSQGNPKEISKYMQPLKMGKRAQGIGRKSLPMVSLANGQLATSRQEAMERWRQHFSDMETGTATTLAELQLSSTSPQTPDISFGDIPSVLEFETQLRKSKRRKASGFDFLPGELLRAAPQHLAYHVYPLVQKMSVWVQEPLQYKGGRLAVLLKKGSATEVSNYRSILVSSSLGKAVHNLWRSRTLPWMRQLTDPLQISAQPGALVSQAAHLIRLHLGMCKRTGVSGFTLFLDIQSAYYCILRQHSLDLDCSDEGVVTLLHRMGIPEATVTDVAEAMMEPSLLAQVGCPNHLRQMMSELHSSTWFIMSEDTQMIRTSRGTRPGDGLADVVWNITFAKFLHRLSARLAATKAFQPLGWNQQIGLLCDIGPSLQQQFAVTWADDTALMGWCVNAQSLIPQLKVTTEIVFTELLRLGMRPNVSEGKTEAIVDLRGANSLQCRQYLHGPCHSCVALDIPTAPDLNDLRVVPAYNHLGGYLTHGARHMTEIKRRVALALRTLSLHRTKIFGNPKIDLERRVALYRTTAHLTLCYNIGTWSTLNNADLQAWRIGVLKVYRRLLHKLYTGHQQFHMTDGAVLRITGLPHPDDLLHLERLRLFGLVLRRNTPYYWTLVAHEQNWLTLTRASFNWLFSQICGLTSMPSPMDDPSAWHSLILDSLPRWKGLLKRGMAHSWGQRMLRQDVMVFRQAFYANLAASGLRIPHQQVAAAREPHKCLVCGQIFSTYRGWAVHAFDSHGRLSRFRQLDDGTCCRSCGKQFPSNFRLVRHFRGNAACAATVASLGFWTSPQPFLGSKQVSLNKTADSMIPWLPSSEVCAPRRAGWAMNACQLRLMKTLARFEWANPGVSEIARGPLRQLLSDVPLHSTEVREAFDAYGHYYSDDVAQTHLQASLSECLAYYTQELGTVRETATQIEYSLDEILDDPLHFQYSTPPPCTRGVPRFLYVLHLFSGVKRKGDIHGFIDLLAAKLSIALCPISVDVALHRKHGDLLNAATQAFWLAKAAAGLLFYVICGPPCESWSVARFRHVEDGTGPRPIRSSLSHQVLWGLLQLRLRELRQVDFANRLLQFALLLLSVQLLVGNNGLLERPDLPGLRCGVQPPSIWLLPEMITLLRHARARWVHLMQGFYGAISPKPTGFLLIADPAAGDMMVQALISGRTQQHLPEALEMGRTSGGFATNPLKRYPAGLCRAISQMVGCGLTGSVSTSDDAEDGIYTVAAALQIGYDQVKEASDDFDAADYNQDGVCK